MNPLLCLTQYDRRTQFTAYGFRIQQSGETEIVCVVWFEIPTVLSEIAARPKGPDVAMIHELGFDKSDP